MGSGPGASKENVPIDAHGELIADGHLNRRLNIKIAPRDHCVAEFGSSRARPSEAVAVSPTLRIRQRALRVALREIEGSREGAR